MVVRVTQTEFELDDGRVYQHPVALDYVPTVEEFQSIYDYWATMFEQEFLKAGNKKRKNLSGQVARWRHIRETSGPSQRKPTPPLPIRQPNLRTLRIQHRPSKRHKVVHPRPHPLGRTRNRLIPPMKPGSMFSNVKHQTPFVFRILSVKFCILNVKNRQKTAIFRILPLGNILSLTC